ncbi:MAG: hypothetical protein KA314_04300 [Chloroflexi bacterium]|nr:hypothetical protein [Chloroflexota bacterium]MBP8055034.1 hypothetical protein [Chloroflexota bacterium]
MTKHLHEQYQPADLVEIQFGKDERWYRGRVVRHDPPGVWVQITNGQMWFVTNTRRIRQAKAISAEE